TRFSRDWSSDVCSSDLKAPLPGGNPQPFLAETTRGNLDVDTVNGFLYYASGSAIKRANLDGTNAVEILSGLTDPRDPTVDGRVEIGRASGRERGEVAVG